MKTPEVELYGWMDQDGYVWREIILDRAVRRAEHRSGGMRNTGNLRFASLDHKGRLVIDVEGAIAAGLWSDEIAAARALGVMIEQKRQRKKKRTPEGESE